MRRSRRLTHIGMLPALLTLGNGFCGLLAIAKIGDALLLVDQSSVMNAVQQELFQGKLLAAAWLIFLGMVFDALDGSVARLVNRTSDFGGQLDSMCDVVTFGVAPALMVKAIMDHYVLVHGFNPHPRLFMLVAVLFALCAILRLARFNAEHDQGDAAHMYFAGLPTPAAAGLVASLVILMYSYPEWNIVKSVPALSSVDLRPAVTWSLPFAAPLLGLLMLSRIRYVHGFNLILQRRRSFPFLGVLLFAIALVIFEPEPPLALVCAIYVVSGPLTWLTRRARGVSSDEDDFEETIEEVIEEEDGEPPFARVK